MKLGRVLGYPKLPCNLLVSGAAGEQCKNLGFARSQRITQIFEFLFPTFQRSRQKQSEEFRREGSQALVYGLQGTCNLTC